MACPHDDRAPLDGLDCREKACHENFGPGERMARGANYCCQMLTNLPTLIADAVREVHVMAAEMP